MIIHADVWADRPVTVEWHRTSHSADGVSHGLPSHTVTLTGKSDRHDANGVRVIFTRAEAEALTAALAAALAEIDADAVTDARMVEADRLHVAALLAESHRG
jgi:hypothetical protein